MDKIKTSALFSVLSFIGMLLMVTGCNSAAKNKTEVSIEQTIIAEGPLFEGSNTAQAESNNALAGLKEMDINIEALKDARLLSCKLWIEPSSDSAEVQNFDLLQSVSLSFAAEKLDMQAAGVLNPIPDGKKEIELNIAQEQENILAFLSQELLYIVADVNLEQDLNDNLEIKCKLTFEVNY